MSERLTIAALRAALAPRPCRYFDAMETTQDLAREWAIDDPQLPSGAVVITDHQTGGRGRHGRVWVSRPGSSLICSIVLRPTLAAEQLPRVTMAGGVAVHDVVAPLLGERVTLKWPNDVLVEGRKMAGILTEATWVGDTLAAVILGIGVNIRADFAGTDLAEIAVSLEQEAGRPVERLPLLVALLERVDHWAARLDDPALVAAWRARLGTLGSPVKVYTEPDKTQSAFYTGIAEAVDDNGALLVRLGSGEVRRVVAGEVGLSES